MRLKIRFTKIHGGFEKVFNELIFDETHFVKIAEEPNLVFEEKSMEVELKWNV